MGFTINADKYSFASKPDPEKVSRDYAAEYAKKLVADEEAARKNDVRDLHTELGTESAARVAADNALSSTISAEVSRATAAENLLSNGKVDKITGKGLSANDFTDTDKTKLDGLKNYDDTAVKALIENKVDKADGYGLSEIKNMTMSPQQGGKYLISTERQDSLISNCTVYKSDGVDDLLANKVDKIFDMGLSEIKNISKTEQPCVLDDGSKGWITNISIIDQNDKYKNITFYEQDTLDTLLSKKTDKPTISSDTESIKIDTNSGNKVDVLTAKGVSTLVSGKADKSIATEYTNTSIVFNLYEKNNHIDSFVSVNASSLSIAISDGEYPTDYTASLSFKTGSAAPETSYTANSNTLVWVGSECSVSGSSSVFAPIANKVYDIVFYFNGANFVGLVNGYSVPTEAEA